MTAGGEVVENYGHLGLMLREHPVTLFGCSATTLRAATAPGSLGHTALVQQPRP
jgi:hypothetical protein